MADIFEISGRIHSTSQEHVVAPASEIFDTAKNRKQDEINTETYSLVNDVNERLSGLNPEQQSALSVAAKATNNETKLGYYVCGTEDNVAAKVISDATGYVLSTGGSIKVKMTNANTAADATLNINSTGAMPLYYDGERASANNTWEAGETVEVYYDGANFYANNVAGGGGDGVFDVSKKYPTSGVEGGNTYTLDGALAVLDANLPASKKEGGMSIQFIQSSDNKYVRYNLLANAFTTDVTQWQGVDAEPIANSKNLVESGGVSINIGTVKSETKTIPANTNPDLITGLEIKANDVIYVKLVGTTDASRLIIRANASIPPDAITIQDHAELNTWYKWTATADVSKLCLWNNGASVIKTFLLIGVASDVEVLKEMTNSLEQNKATKVELSNGINEVTLLSTAFEFIDGYYASSSSIATYTENDGYSCRLIKVNKGEKYIVKGHGTSGARLWFTADDNNNIIRRADASVVDYDGIVITINDGETKFGYNTSKAADVKELRYYGFIQEEFQKQQENTELLKVTSKVNKLGYFDTSYSNTAAIWQWFNISVKKGELYTISVTSNNNWSRLIIAINSSNQKRCYDNSTSVNSYTGTFLANEDIESIGIYAAVGTGNLVSLSVDKELLENNTRNEIGLNGIKFPATEMNRARQDMAAFCFVFDDGDAKDDDVVTLFDQFNIKCGFALIGQDSFVNPNGRGSKYLFYQNKGYSCLNHNSSAADLESYATEAEAAAAISSAKNLLDNLGIVTNGWVCPNNKWVSNFRNLLGSFHAYAFGDHGYGEGTQVYDVNTRTQDILRLHRYDIQDISTLQAIKDTIDLACQNGYMVCFYGHAKRIGMEGYYTMAMIQEIIEYLIVKRNAGQCFLSSPDEVVKYYFNL